MKANKVHAMDLVSSSSARLRTRLSRCGESQRKHGPLLQYFPSRDHCGVIASQCAAAEKVQPNKYRKGDIYKIPHPRQPTKSDMRTDGCCVCARTRVRANRLTLSGVYGLCVHGG